MSIPSPVEVAAQLRTNADTIASHERAIADLTEALRGQREREALAAPVVDTPGNAREAISKDGHIRWIGRTEAASLQDPIKQWRPGLLDNDRPLPGDWGRELSRAITMRNLAKMLTPRLDRSELERNVCDLLATAPGALAQTAQAREAKEFARSGEHHRVFSNVSTAGGNWIPEQWLPELERYASNPRQVENLFAVRTVSTDTAYFPTMTQGLRPYLAGVATDDNPGQFTPSSIVTGNPTYAVPKMAVRSVVDTDAAADSMIDAFSELMEAHAVAHATGFEDCLINGSTGTHPDTALASWDPRGLWGSSGLGTASDHRRGFVGLRARAIAISNDDDASASMTYATLLGYRNKLSAQLSSGSDVVIICSPEVYIKHLLAISEVATLEKFGQNATVFRGALAAIGGMPIIVSDLVTADLQTTGRFTTTGGATTGLLMVATSRFHRIVRRGMMMESQADVTRGITHLVSSARRGFRPRLGESNTEKNVWFGFNVTP